MYSSSTVSLCLALLPTVFATVHDIQVGAGGKLVYEPEAIFAEPGDSVVFHFNPKNHTVTQSSLADPCGLMPGGIDSGFQPVNASMEAPPTFTVDVKDKNPMWFYCKQANKTPQSHCGQGMVFSVNCGPDGAPNSFTNFKASALAAGAAFAASASASAAAPSATGYGGDAGAGDAAQWTTAAYGGYTVPAAPKPSVVTETITLDQEVWTTTYASWAGSPAPTPASAEGNVIIVKVGNGGLVFDPPRVSAQPRDTIQFEFHAKNHTVTQSAFTDPCRRLNANGTQGFDSGFVPVDASLTEGFPTWNLTVNDTAPIWAYCRQANHCGSGMVFAINSNEESPRNFSAFQNLAKEMNGTAAAVSSPTGSGAAPEATGDGALAVQAGTAGVAAILAMAAALVL